MSVESILQLSDDQLSNQAQLVFPKGIPTGGNSEEIQLRIDQVISLPSEELETYEINMKGAKLVKTAMKEATAKEFTVQVRLDQQWNVYDTLNDWFKACYDPITNIALPELLSRCPIVIQFTDRSNAIVKNITFNYCKIKSLKIGDADPTSNEPIRLELGFIYGYKTND